MATDVSTATGLIASKPLAALGVLVIAVVAIALLRKTALLRDGLVPQIAPSRRTYSLAKTQMAFWTVLILSSFLYVVLTHDVDIGKQILSPQAVTLMGLSLLTAGGASAVDSSQKTAEDVVSAGLAAGSPKLQTSGDVDQLRKDAAASGPAQAALQAQLKAVDDQLKPFETENLLLDLVTNRDGLGLHRLQAVVWTLVIGAVFVWKTLSNDNGQLPELDSNLLAVMGISSAGYVGFKINEQNY